jgi:hypothetical protein
MLRSDFRLGSKYPKKEDSKTRELEKRDMYIFSYSVYILVLIR